MLNHFLEASMLNPRPLKDSHEFDVIEGGALFRKGHVGRLDSIGLLNTQPPFDISSSKTS